MRRTDIAIVGGGLAGSLSAAMLGRAGYRTTLVDPRTEYPAEFRCEKLDRVQIELLKRTGILSPVLRASTPDQEAWVARRGRVVEKLQETQRGILYQDLVNTVRAEVPDCVEFVQAKATGIATTADRQTVTLANGEEISARLVILATGPNPSLRDKLGIEREIISPTHSVSIGFDVEPAAGGKFPFSSMAYFTEHAADRLAYITLFPIGETMRANMFAYRDLHDPWLKQLRDAPVETLAAVWPNLGHLMGEYRVTSFVQIRPVDLFVMKGYRQSGVVLVGDAFSSSCPAAGTGARKVLVDVERLCNVHIPQWLTTPGMSEAKISAFYDDPIKQACEALCRKKAFTLRSYSIEPSMTWSALRWAKFFAQWGRGTVRRIAGASRGIGASKPFADEQDYGGWIEHKPVAK